MSVPLSRWSVSVLTPDEEAVIRRAAESEREYHAMLKGSDDQRRRLAIMQRRVELDTELSGAPKPLPPADLSATLEEAVARELVNLTPGVRTQLVLRRQAHRLGVNCGPVQLQMSRAGSARRKLIAIKRASRLCMREIAHALGIAERTLERHVAGEKINGERRLWYENLESIDVDGDFYHILVRRGAPKRRRWGWHLSREERHALLTGSRVQATQQTDNTKADQ